MKKQVFFWLIMTIFAFSCPAWAQKAPLIGVIDTQKFMDNSAAVKSKRQAFLQEIEKKRGALLTKQQEIQKLDAELKSGGAKMAAAERGRKQEELARDLKEFQRMREDLNEEFRRKNEEITRRIFSEVKEIAQDYQKKKKYTLILEKNFIVAADGATDITGDIIKAYDAKNKK